MGHAGTPVPRREPVMGRGRDFVELISRLPPKVIHSTALCADIGCGRTHRNVPSKTVSQAGEA